MGARKFLLLFLSAMCLSIIVMVIIYGLFIKDFNLSLNVKNPESAPSPIDLLDGKRPEEEEDSGLPPVRVNLPSDEEHTQAQSPGSTEESAPPAAESDIKDVLPLSPNLSPSEGLTPDAAEETTDPSSGTSEPAAPEASVESPPSLHFVYMDGFSSQEAANYAIQQLHDRKLAFQPYIRQHRGQIILQFGVFSDRENAELMADQLRRQHVYVKVD